MATYVKNVRFGGVSGSTKPTFSWKQDSNGNIGQFINPRRSMWSATGSTYQITDYIYLYFSLVDDSSGHDANVLGVIIKGATSNIIYWNSDERFTTNGDKSINMMPDNIEEFVPEDTVDLFCPFSWTSYNGEAFQARTENLNITFILESGGSWYVPSSETVTIPSPFSWTLPKCTALSFSGSYPTSFYKNDTFSTSGLIVKGRMEGTNGAYSLYTLPSDYYYIYSPNMSSAGTKSVLVQSTFRSGNAVSKSYNITVYGISSYNLGNLRNVESGNKLKYPVSDTNIATYIPTQATINYDNGQTQTIAINSSYVSGDTDLTSYGIKYFTITIPASLTYTQDAVSQDYAIDVYTSTDIADSYAWATNNGGSTTKYITLVKDTTNKVFWAKPCILTVSGKEYYDTKTFQAVNYPCSTLTSGDKLTDGTHIVHYGDTINLVKKSDWNEDYDFVPTEDDSISATPTKTGGTTTSLTIYNNNDYAVTLLRYDPSSCGGEWVSWGNVNSKSEMTRANLQASTSYNLRFRTNVNWKRSTYRAQSNLSDGIYTICNNLGNQSGISSASITCSKFAIATSSLSKYIYSNSVTVETTAKSTPPLVNLGIWQDTLTQALVNIDNGHHTTKIHYWYVDRNGSHDKTVTLTYEGSIPSTSEWVQKFNDRKITFYAQIIAADGTSYPASSYNNGPITTIEIAQGDFS